jgi:hypothetical protein
MQFFREKVNPYAAIDNIAHLALLPATGCIQIDIKRNIACHID